MPRYVWGDALRGMGTWVKARFAGTAAQRMSGELAVWHLAGRLYGRFAIHPNPALRR